MISSTSEAAVANDSAEIRWNADSRIAHVRYSTGSKLVAADGPFLVDTLTAWIGTRGEPFAVLADAAGLRSTDAEYRASVSGFFKRHRASAYVALLDAAPLIQVVVDLFRVGTGVQLKSFSSEEGARAWLRDKGIRA